MILLILGRLADWEYEAHIGYVSSFAKHGAFSTYADGYGSYVNESSTSVVTPLYSSEQPREILTAIYGDIQATQTSEDGSIRIYMNFTTLNDEDVEETIWEELEDIRIRDANAKAINIYEDTIAYTENKGTNFYKFERQMNEFGELVPIEIELLGHAAESEWQFFNVPVNGSEMAFVAVFDKGGFYALNISAGTTTLIPIRAPEFEGETGLQLLYCNSSETTSVLVISMLNGTIAAATVLLDQELDTFEMLVIEKLDVTAEILPLIGLEESHRFGNMSLYRMEHVLLYKMDYLAVYPLINDSTVLYVNENAEFPQYSIQLVRLFDKNIFNLTVDRPPAFIYSDCFSYLYLMGTQDDSVSGYFSIAMNGLIEPSKNQFLSCWTEAQYLNVLYDSGERKITISLIGNESCSVVAPEAIIYQSLAGSQSMIRNVSHTESGDRVAFYVFLEKSPQNTFDVVINGAVGKDSDGFLASDMSIGFPLSSYSSSSCWEDPDNLDIDLASNLLHVTVKKQAGCTLDQPRVSAVVNTSILEKVALEQFGMASPYNDEEYFYFFDPTIETFAGDVDMTFFVEEISPSGSPVGDEFSVEVSKVSTDITSCWNNDTYVGMSYNFDHFELLLYNRIWEKMDDPVCDPRVEFDELEVEFSYKTKHKKTLRLSEKDFQLLPNGRLAYFMEFDVYEDWVSSTVWMYSEKKAEPIVGDKFILDGDYPIEFVDPESCFSYPELLSVEYNGDHSALVTADHEYWCKDAPVDDEYHFVVYALNQDPDQDGDYPYCNFSWDGPKARYFSNDCELELGYVVNMTLYEVRSFVNEHDEWEEGDVIVETRLLAVVNSRYDYTYLIIVAVFGGVLIIGFFAWFGWWYVARFRPSGNNRISGADERTNLLESPPPDADELCRPPESKSSHRRLFKKKTAERGFDDELFATIPAPPKKE